jgi:bifunctional DNase/RNase
VRITDLLDGVFYAVIDLGDGVEVSARPSDAIALALRCDAPILGADEVLEAAGVPVADDEEDEVKAFREFIENVSPEDFERGDS